MYKVDFLNKLKEGINDKSTADLEDIIIKLAKLLPSASYPEVLSWFKAEEIQVQEEDNDQEGVSDQSDAILSKIAELSAEIEDGKYPFYWNYEHDYYHRYDYDYDEAEDELIDENGLGDILTVLFREIIDLADKGEFVVARQIFDKLFGLTLNYEYDNITVERLFEYGLIAIPYSKVIYTRAYCVLMSMKGKVRANHIFEIFSANGYDYKDFKIDNLLQVGAAELDDEREFLEDWIKYLMKQRSNQDSEIVEFFLLDAVTHVGGIGALEKFVDEYGMLYPTLCFKLIEIYLSEEQYDKAVVVIRDGCNSLVGINKEKQVLADYLITIAEMVDNYMYFKEGVFEGFKATLYLSYFIEIYQLQDKLQINEAMDYLERNKDQASDFDYYGIYFLMGYYKLVWEKCAEDKNALGWSSTSWNPSLKGNLFPLFVALLTRGKIGKGVEKLIGNRLPCEMLVSAIKRISDEEYQLYFNWCKDEIHNRVVAIVSNQHRGSYNKASELIVAMAEVIEQEENELIAMSYVRSFKKMFPRHNAFVKCLRNDLEQIGWKL